MALFQESILSKIEQMDQEAVFVASDFSDIADINTVRQVLSRQEKAGKIQRIFRGVYYCPVYSELLGEYEAPSPHQVALALGRKYGWTLAPSGNTALNQLGLSAQVARTFRICLPNEWSYELATEVMQDYVRRNFTSQGMCCDFAIHDSENKKTYQRNLHCHIMLTMRPLTKEGEWDDKQHFIYKLDKDGNKIRKKNGKGYEGHSEPTTDGNSKDKASEWRKDLADIINSVNDRIGNTENLWEHRSFKERGLDMQIRLLRQHHWELVRRNCWKI